MVYWRFHNLKELFSEIGAVTELALETLFIRARSTERKKCHRNNRPLIIIINNYNLVERKWFFSPLENSMNWIFFGCNFHDLKRIHVWKISTILKTMIFHTRPRSMFSMFNALASHITMKSENKNTYVLLVFVIL